MVVPWSSLVGAMSAKITRYSYVSLPVFSDGPDTELYCLPSDVDALEAKFERLQGIMSDHYNLWSCGEHQHPAYDLRRYGKGGCPVCVAEEGRESARKELLELKEKSEMAWNCLSNWQSRFCVLSDAWRDGDNATVLNAVREFVKAEDGDAAAAKDAELQALRDGNRALVKALLKATCSTATALVEREQLRAERDELKGELSETMFAVSHWQQRWVDKNEKLEALQLSNDETSELLRKSNDYRKGEIG